MKKNLTALLLACLMMTAILPVSSFAKTGDIIGYAKYTDISAYINHYPITSYNINGYTAVVAEDLSNYGFHVVWNDYARALYISRNWEATEITPYGRTFKYASLAGQNSFAYLETDIRTYINGTLVESFNINGKTCVYIDSLVSCGEVVWVPEIRAIKLWLAGLPIKNYAPLTEIPKKTNLSREEMIAEVESDGFKVQSWSGKGLVCKDYDNVYMSDYSYCLTANIEDDLRLIKTFPVKKNTDYRISAYIKTENVKNHELGYHGANISSGDWNNSELLLLGDHDWIQVELVTNSGNNTTLQGSFNLGYMANTCTGKIYVDGISCEEVTTKVKNTGKTYVPTWAEVSSIQQFSYRKEGIAYAYQDDETLHIVTPSKEILLAMKYPLLGDVISDDDGNFYVVWGKKNEGSNVTVETIFISKYSDTGLHIKTTGFVGESRMGENGNTQSPFDAGSCHSAIHDNILMVNYARGMYLQHQSNNVIGVYTNNMNPVKFASPWDVPYTSHSFNQRVLWSTKANDFVYVDHGDGYDRGFTINTHKSSQRIFTFYLPANANYNMGIVNKTYAQLGGLLETSDGVVLVGASAKSISEKAFTEKQNLFVQIFNPNASQISKSMFIGGENRNGATSFDINDNQNTPLTSVTDYGVHWITDYTDRDVIAPHSVVANDKIVILWTEMHGNIPEAFYTVLSSDGNILKAPTSLGLNRQLNSFEDPIFHNGKIYWVSAYNRRIVVDHFNLDV